MNPETPPQHAAIYAAVKAHYLSLGRTEAQWETVVAPDPRKFNRVWRHLLKLPAADTAPPPQYQNMDPATGEIFR